MQLPKDSAHFHERALVAPLKLQTCPAAQCRIGHFHERALVAPLKQLGAQCAGGGVGISTSARSWPH